MKFFNFLHKKKKTDLEIEEEITEEVIKENEAEVKRNITGIVIKYMFDEDSSEIPEMIKICNLHSSILPDINSIIWAPNKNQNKLLPYIVIRYDFIEDLETDACDFTYIVVKDAEINDIIN